MSGRVGHVGDLGVMAVGALLARPGRAVGLMVPVAVGVATIVASFGASASARAGLEQDLVRLGADQVHVQPVPRRGAETARLPVAAATRARLLPTARAVSARTELVDHRVQPSVAVDPLAPTSAEAVVLATDTALPEAVGVGCGGAGSWKRSTSGGPPTSWWSAPAWPGLSGSTESASSRS